MYSKGARTAETQPTHLTRPNPPTLGYLEPSRGSQHRQYREISPSPSRSRGLLVLVLVLLLVLLLVLVFVSTGRSSEAPLVTSFDVWHISNMIRSAGEGFDRWGAGVVSLDVVGW